MGKDGVVNKLKPIGAEGRPLQPVVLVGLELEDPEAIALGGFEQPVAFVIVSAPGGYYKLRAPDGNEITVDVEYGAHLYDATDYVGWCVFPQRQSQEAIGSSVLSRPRKDLSAGSFFFFSRKDG